MLKLDTMFGERLRIWQRGEEEEHHHVAFEVVPAKLNTPVPTQVGRYCTAYNMEYQSCHFASSHFHHHRFSFRYRADHFSSSASWLNGTNGNVRYVLTFRSVRSLYIAHGCSRL